MSFTFWLMGPEERHESARLESLTLSRGGGGGQEADPVQVDGMRAPPATEAEPETEVTDVKLQEVEVVNFEVGFPADEVVDIFS